jgi:Na+-driven multidrug efflux pump
MWCCRVALAVVLIRVYNFGIIAVWIGMFTDWFVRAVIFSARFMSGKWLKKKVI